MPQGLFARTQKSAEKSGRSELWKNKLLISGSQVRALVRPPKHLTESSDYAPRRRDVVSKKKL